MGYYLDWSGDYLEFKYMVGYNDGTSYPLQVTHSGRSYLKDSVSVIKVYDDSYFVGNMLRQEYSGAPQYGKPKIIAYHNLTVNKVPVPRQIQATEMNDNAGGEDESEKKEKTDTIY